MTKKEMFNEIMSIASDREDIVEFCKHEIELLGRKRSTSSKPTKRQTENEVLKRNILDILAEGEPLTATQIAAMLSTDEDTITNQRASALLRQLCVGEAVQKNTVKGKAMFSLA